MLLVSSDPDSGHPAQESEVGTTLHDTLIMGTAYFIVLERKIDGLDTTVDGKMLARISDILDAIAPQLGVRPISEFISIDPAQAAEFMDGDLGDIELPQLQQFSAQDGLATVRALLSRPEAQPAIQDLQDCERILGAAAQHGVSWHLEVDI